MKFKRFLCLLLSTALFILSACSVKVSIGDRSKNINEVLEKTKNEYYDSIVAQQGVEDFKLYLKGDNEVVYEYILSDDSLSDESQKLMKEAMDAQVTGIYDGVKKDLQFDTLILTYKYVNKNNSPLFEISYDDNIIKELKNSLSKYDINETVVKKEKSEIDELLKNTKAQIYDSLMATNAYKDFDLYLNDNYEVVYEYIYKDDITLKDNYREVFKTTADNLIISQYGIMRQEVGIDDLVIIFRLLYGDKTVAYELKYNKDIVSHLQQ